MLNLIDFYLANKRIKEVVRVTPLEFSHSLSDFCEGEVWLKLENYQVANSFKIRGATNKILLLSDNERKKGIVTASSGNHAQGVGYAAQKFGVKATIIIPENTPKVKIDAISKYDIELVIEGKEYIDSEKIARKMEKNKGLTYVSAYNDLDLIAGQGTIAIEMIQENPSLELIVIPVGGGGLASGISSVYKKATDASTIGVQSEASPVMFECLIKGEIFDVPLKDSYADGLHGGIEKTSVTFDICRDNIDEWIILKENSILESIKFMLHENHMLVEGAGAVGPAAILEYPERFENKKTGVVISGGNLDLNILKKVLE